MKTFGNILFGPWFALYRGFELRFLRASEKRHRGVSDMQFARWDWGDGAKGVMIGRIHYQTSSYIAGPASPAGWLGRYPRETHT